jgi:hypothetical protein
MVRALTLVAGLALATGLGGAVSAATITPQTSLLGAPATEGSLLQKAQWGHCGYWRRECARRWGWRTPGYWRCLRRHDCGGGPWWWGPRY